jgi:DnaD/phage-associated family protein
MNYTVNAEVFSNTFGFPRDVADKYLKFCKGEHIKVLVYIMRNPLLKPSVEEIANGTDVSIFDVKEALLFWADAGILIAENTKKEIEKTKKVAPTLKPTREDVTKRALSDPKLNYLLNQAQMIFSRNLKGNEMQTLAWLYEDVGLDVSVILFIVQYAKQIGKANIRFIESLASEWADKGVENIADAEEQVRLLTLTEQCWSVVCQAFGIEKRKPSKKESEFSLKWVNEWHISSEMLSHAYDVCIDAKSKFTFAYIAKIIENWHNSGYKTPKDIKPKEKSSDSSTVTFDINLYEEMLNSKD